MTQETQQKIPDIVLLQHRGFGYFTGRGWSACKGDASRMTEAGAESWLRTFREFSTDDYPFLRSNFVLVKGEL